MSDEGTIRIRPGYLVSMATRIEGGVTYQRVDLGRAVQHEDTRDRETIRWETTRVVVDVAEYERAKVARSRVRSLVTAACVPTPFGLLCATDNLPALDAAIAEASETARTFNAGAATVRVEFKTLRGRIAETSEEAVSALRDELRALLESMTDATRAGDVETVRDVTRRATVMGRMLEQDTEAASALTVAVRTARNAARAIVKRVEKEGHKLADVLAEIDLAPVAAARFAFMSTEAREEFRHRQIEESMPTVDLTRFGSLGTHEPPPDSDDDEGDETMVSIDRFDNLADTTDDVTASDNP